MGSPEDMGVPCGTGSRASHGATKASPPEASIPSAALAQATEQNVTVGTMLVCDGGFPCLDDGAKLIVEGGAGGLFVPCRDGKHYLDGQADESGNYVGLFLAGYDENAYFIVKVPAQHGWKAYGKKSYASRTEAEIAAANAAAHHGKARVIERRVLIQERIVNVRRREEADA